MCFNSKSLSQILIYEQKQSCQSWEEFYENTKIPTKTKYFLRKEQQFLPVLTELNYYVHNAIFKSLTSSTNGGGVLISLFSSDAQVLIEESYFYQCLANSIGGGIYKETNGHSVINKVCGILCEAPTSTFCNILTDKTATKHFNYVFNSHINSCESKNQGYTIMLYYGATSLKDINMSHNSAFYWPCFDLLPTTEENTYPEVSFSTFDSNIASNRGCFFINASDLDVNIKNINCLYNRQEGTIEGLFLSHTNTDITIEDSSFIENKSKGVYFYVYPGGSITLKNCSIADQITTNTKITTNAIGTESFLNDMDLINEGNCMGYVYKPRISCGTKENNDNVFLFSILIVQF